jgi:ATP-binding cassette subfamily B protein
MWRRNNFPISYQLDTSDCGAACLDMIARHYRRGYSKEQIKEFCRQDRQGVSIGGIGVAAEQLGFRSLAVRVSFDDLRTKAPLPCVAYFSEGHFVVIYKVTSHRVYIADPAAGLTTYSRSEFEACWLTKTSDPDWGVLLLFEDTAKPSHPARPGAELRHSVLRPLWQDLKRHILGLGLAVSAALFVQFMLPFLSAKIVDIGVANRDLHILYVIVGAQLVLVVSRFSVELLESWILLFIGLRVHARLISQFIDKLMRLPLSFFDGKLLGDLIQRINDHKTLQEFSTETAWRVALALLSLIVLSIVLLLFKPLVFFLFLIGSIAYLYYCAAFVKHQRLLGHKSFRLSAQKQGMTIELLAGMQEVRLNNAEQQRRWQWQVAQQSLENLNAKLHVIGNFQGTGGTAINQLKDLLITFIVAKEVISGNMTIGGMIAVQFIIGQLSWPLTQIMLVICQSHEVTLSYERAKEIYVLQDEDSALQSRPRLAFGGDIRFTGVSFSYGGPSDSATLFSDLSLTIPEGQTTAIVGTSGSGKTTLLKLILKFYPILSGQIKVGSTNLADMSAREWRERCGVVMQEGYIFSDTILNNIVVAEDRLDMVRFREIIRLVQIDRFIDSLALSWETRIGRDGVGVSRGQAQRILIARALYRDPQYIFFDEATSALDAETESMIVNDLRAALRNKTVVVIAHRMSTVRHADQIIVLEDGRVVQSGLHAELAAHRGGRYFALIKNQLELGQ